MQCCINLKQMRKGVKIEKENSFCFYRLIGQKVNDLNRIETVTTTLSI